MGSTTSTSEPRDRGRGFAVQQANLTYRKAPYSTRAPSLGLLTDDRAVDDEAARGKDSSLGGSVEPGNCSLVGQVLDRAEVRLQRSLCRRHLPLGQVHIPQRAVATLTGIPAQHVERIKAVEYRGIQALPIGIARTRLAVGERCQTCAR